MKYSHDGINVKKQKNSN
ncbi:Protein of unknown function [Bacillus mycoides]|uniref:Uncharacterized protein n=2 Tax=Bacillus cereus group TaxID=86661 RepID=A0A1C4ATY4_BACTU|nr:Protein of unknown function [Bacillus mycoides]SCB97259.1 Protein of unknown function [Bacillus wiedmannii]SCB98039.1 Protein of unknown function [Bacillus thuringiensis]